ncbi:MAG: PTS transporter subunit EIIC, partial [Oscillospiraceae bacterium]|nr:PTS transporter subunit EIIC [Oscillospiraceae bacterium]
MLPIALLPVAGLFLGLGSSFTNQTTIEHYNLSGIIGEGTILYNILIILKDCGSVIFENLPLLFAVGVAIGMAKKEKAVAALSSIVGFLVMHSAVHALLDITGKLSDGVMPQGALKETLGIMSMDMGVFGGIIVGLIVSVLHNRFYDIKLPKVIAFFGGTRFVPIITAVTFIVVGALMFFIWQYVQNEIMSLAELINSSGYFGTLLFGLVKRSLIPFGLHHVFYTPFWQTSLGGTMEVAGQMVSGAQNIFFAQLADPSVNHFSVEATKYFTGEYVFMMFGLSGAALAMYTCAKPEKKKIIAGLLIPAALTSFLTGITEPIEFTFLFVAPLLYVVQVVLAGISYPLMQFLNCTIGCTFSCGFIDFTLFGLLQGNEKTGWIWVPIIGVIYFALYFIIFRFLILKFNFKTPGREDDEETKLFTKEDYMKKKQKDKDTDSSDNYSNSKIIIEALGGNDNIADLDACATRLRITLKDPSLFNESLLKKTGTVGIIVKGDGVQAVYGPQVNVVKSNLDDYL